MNRVVLYTYQGRRNRGAQGHVPPSIWSNVVGPLQYFQKILGLTKWVPPQYLTPSYGPAYIHRCRVYAVNSPKMCPEGTISPGKGSCPPPHLPTAASFAIATRATAELKKGLTFCHSRFYSIDMILSGLLHI